MSPQLCAGLWFLTELHQVSLGWNQCNACLVLLCGSDPSPRVATSQPAPGLQHEGQQVEVLLAALSQSPALSPGASTAMNLDTIQAFSLFSHQLRPLATAFSSQLPT